MNAHIDRVVPIIWTTILLIGLGFTNNATSSQIALGNGHICAQTGATEVSCLGDNSQGQLGNGTTNQTTDLVKHTFSSEVLSIEAGISFSCALLKDNSVQCWGNNIFGQLGNGTTDNSPSPVSSKMPVSALSLTLGGWQACATGPEVAPAPGKKGNIYCWGDNSRGQLAQGIDIKGGSLSEPKQIDIKPEITYQSELALVSGHDFVCLLVKKNGRVWCWGGNTNGAIGIGTNIDATVPMQVLLDNSDTATKIVAGEGHVCALLDTGAVKCWGSNDWGQLGDNKGGDGKFSLKPTTVMALGPTDKVLSMVAGRTFTCFLLEGGKIKCVGDDKDFQKINQDPENQSVIGIYSNIMGLCALKADNHIKCWGDYIGNTNYSSIATYIPPPAKSTLTCPEGTAPDSTNKVCIKTVTITKNPATSEVVTLSTEFTPIIANKSSGGGSCSLVPDQVVSALTPISVFLITIGLTGFTAYRSSVKPQRVREKTKE